jgi:acyl-CoA thioester hydrolase
VSWNDCDPSGRIRFQAVFDWFVDAEVALLEELGVGDAFGTMPRVAADARWTNGIWFGDTVEIAVEVVEVGRSSVRYRFTIDNHGEQAVSGEVTCVNVADGHSAALPANVRAALEASR